MERAEGGFELCLEDGCKGGRSLSLSHGLLFRRARRGGVKDGKGEDGCAGSRL